MIQPLGKTNFNFDMFLPRIQTENRIKDFSKCNQFCLIIFNFLYIKKKKRTTLNKTARIHDIYTVIYL